MQILEQPLVSSAADAGATRKTLRIAMLGMIPGNGHPFSWSAIINGYDAEAAESCPYPVINAYLSRQPAGSVRIEGAAVTHLWTDEPSEAAAVARFARIPHVVARPEEVLGEVDAVMIATDDGDDHVSRARPFVEAGIPVFIDKPMATNVPDLRTFIDWKNAGAKLLSSSGMRYAPELGRFGSFPWQWLTGVTCNTWKRYGIHVLEPAYCLTGPGYVTVRASAQGQNVYVELLHQSGRVITLSVLPDAKAAFGCFHAYGEGGELAVRFSDTYSAFRGQLLSFVDFALTGRAPHGFEETVELMTIVIAAEESLRRDGARIDLAQYRKEIDV